MVKCQFCGYVNQEKDKCLLFGIPIPEDNNKSCTYFTYRARRCDVCGGLLIPHAHVILEKIADGYARICDNCYQYIDKCPTCDHAQEQCNFEIIANSSGIPPIVQKVVQQGPMQMITQVKNPELIAQACPGCICYQNERCLREFGDGCHSYLLHVVP